MSLILDALKKSEGERQRQDTPGIANIPETEPKKRSSKWAWTIGSLLIINIGILSVIMLTPTQIAQEIPDDPLPISPDKKLEKESFSEMVEEAVPSTPKTGAIINQDTEIPTKTPMVPVTPVSENRPQVAAGLPTFNALRAQGILPLGDLHLDIHVYSSQATERFVFLNMSKYRENMVLAEGPILHSITPDGVVLEYKGIQFLLPRE